VKPKDTPYKGYWFRSRLEARWAVFFDTLGLKWLYEPEGFDLQFDFEDFAKELEMSEEELLDEGVPQALKALDGRVISYLPDFYLPELNYWIEIKPTRPNKVEILKAFFLSYHIYKAAVEKIEGARTAKEQEQAWEDLNTGGMFIFYGDIPWPFPERGNAVGYGATCGMGGIRYGLKKLYAHLGLCWQQCRLCSKVGINSFGNTYCRDCKSALETAIYPTIYSRTGTAEENGEDPLTLAKKQNSLVQEVLNLDFFTNGHKTPALQNAYEAARSARFEHGAAPRPSG
jgi:hypothetical protein